MVARAGKRDGPTHEATIHVVRAGQPVSGATVYFLEQVDFEPSGPPKPPAPFVTDAQGNAKISLRGSEVLALVIAKDFAPLQEVVKFKDSAPAELSLDTGVVGRIQFTSLEGEPFADAPVMLSSMAPVFGFHVLCPENAILLGRTDENGYFTWRHAPRAFALVGIPSMVFRGLPAYTWDAQKEPKKLVQMRSR
jgi:hypothetical protein